MNTSGMEAPASIETGKSWISKTLGVAGGEACVRRTRITVWGLVEWKREGLSDAELLNQIEGLSPEDLKAAWEYAAANPEEIDRAIRLNQEA